MDGGSRQRDADAVALERPRLLAERGDGLKRSVKALLRRLGKDADGGRAEEAVRREKRITHRRHGDVVPWRRKRHEKRVRQKKRVVLKSQKRRDGRRVKAANGAAENRLAALGRREEGARLAGDEAASMWSDEVERPREIRLEGRALAQFRRHRKRGVRVGRRDEDGDF